MKKSLLSAFLLFFWVTSFSQTDGYNQKIMDPKAEQEILIGFCTRDGLMSSNFSTYFKDEYTKYKPDPAIVKAILPKMHEVILTIVMGTWCSDSREQVPRLFTILDALGYKDAVAILCVDKDKKAGSVSMAGMNIEKVPTIIFYKENIELGRIIETPAFTLEKDMLAIVSK